MSFRHLQTHIERTRQKRKALHMLTLSGVVRPGHVELRYTIPLSMVEDITDSSHKNPATSVEPSSIRKLLALMIRLMKEHRSFRLHLPTFSIPKFRKAAPTDILPSP